MLKELFASGSRIKLLEQFLLNPRERYYQRQVADLLGLVVGSVQQEMPRLVKAGVLTVERDGNRVYYRANPKCPIFPELKAILLKAGRVSELLRSRLERHQGSIAVAFIGGSYAKGEEEAWSDIDLFVVGEIGSRALADIVSKAQEGLGREINATVYSPADFRRKLKSKDSFVAAVAKEPKIFVVGDADDLGALAAE